MISPLEIRDTFVFVRSDSTRSDVPERYDENFHLDSSNKSLSEVYSQIKSKMKRFKFNPQKYYISIIKEKNFAFILLRRTKMHIVVMLPFKEGKRLIKKHNISTLSEGVQNFYNGECFRLTIENKKNLSEVINILKIAAEKSS